MSNFRKGLFAVVVPMTVLMLVIGFNVESWGPPKWVGYVLIVELIYWAAAILTAVVLAILRKSQVAGGVAVGTGMGLFILLLSAGLCL